MQKARFGDRTAAVYTNLSGSDSDEQDIVLPMSDGGFGYLSFVANKGQLTLQRPLISAIVSSFERGAAVTASSGAACTVSIDSANSAQLRVGPGTNRGAISFLPANADVTVTGRIELDSGSVWYQLDKSEAAPGGSAAAELWVAADDVTASGDCEHVGETSAPPIVPIAPQSQPTSASPAPGGEQNAPPAGNAEPGALPAAGAWVIVLNPVLNASCQGGDNFTFNTAEYFDPTTYGDTLVIRDSGSFYYTGDIFTRISGTSSFSGTFTYKDGTVAPVRFDMVSATRMTGHITVNYDIEGTPCSETVQFVATHG